MEKKYYIGLDIGTSSCGFCVTDANYNLQNVNDKDLWGVRLFDQAQTAVERRSKRASRRNLNREKQRLALLQGIFKQEIEKVDKNFFHRLKSSALWEDDKIASGIFSRNSLFFDNELNDKTFFNKYPTIYHLRESLLNNPSQDIRYLYLAISNMMKHRGNFLLDSYNQTTQNLTQLMDLLNQKIVENEEFAFLQFNMNQQSKNKLEVLDKKLATNFKNVTKLEQEFKDIFGKGNSNFNALIKAICGGTVNAKTIFSTKNNELEFDGKIENFGVDDDVFDSFLLEVESISSFASEILLLAREVYNRVIFRRVLGDDLYFCSAMVRKYNLHQSQLKHFKKVIKTYYKEHYNNIFKLPKIKDEKVSENLKNNYPRYIEGFNKYINNKNISNKCSADEFYTYVKTVLDLKPELKDISDINIIYEQMNNKEFLPKLRTSANSVIPYQVNLMELEHILNVSSQKYPFLVEKDEQGISNKDKIIQIFKFRIPYFVGPLTKNENCKNAWLKTKLDEQIFPWNFDKVVDLDLCEKEFIERMKNNCSELSAEPVLPKNSLLYSEYMALQELNVLKINGEPISSKFKNELLNYMKKNGTLTIKRLKSLAIDYRYFNVEDSIVVSGIDEDKFKSNLNIYKNFNIILDGKIEENREIVEQIIEYATICSDKQRLQKWLEKKYSTVLTNEQIKKIKGLKLSEWGRFSKKFLDGITGIDYKTGERKTIIDFMRSESKNLMTVIADYGFAESINDLRTVKDRITYSDIKNLYCSPAVKRAVWQSVKIVKEIVQIMGCNPEKIFIEVTRQDEEKPNGIGKRTVSRKQTMQKIYAEIKKDFNENIDYLKSKLEKEEKLDSERLFLYYQQLGKCMYTGETINVDKLFSNEYDIDHIIPQSKIKDDSLDNKVLVKRQFNIDKSNNIVDLNVQNKNQHFWKNLLDNNLISSEKYNRLTRKTEYSQKELEGFINRQMVFTNQTAKAVIDLFRQTMSGTEIVYSKAKYVSEFRNCEFKFEKDIEELEFGKQLKDCLVKCRNVNDFHHAKDAFLNIFVGNVMYEKYTKKFYNKQLTDFNIQRAFKFDTPNVFCMQKDLKNIITVMNSNTPMVTFASRQKKGKFYKETIWGTEKHQKDFDTIQDIQDYSSQFFGEINSGRISLKSKDNPISNTLKYGHLSDYEYAYFVIIKYVKNGKEKINIVAIPTIFANEIKNNNDLIQIIKKLTDLQQFEIIIKKLNAGSIIKYGGGYFKLLGNAGDKVKICNYNQIYLKPEFNYYFKNVCKVLEQIKLKQIKDEQQEKLLVKTNRFGQETFLTKQENFELLKQLISHASNGIYKNTNIYSTAKKVKENLNVFKDLNCFNQLLIIQGMLDILTGKNGGNLKPIGLSQNSGVCSMSKNLNLNIPLYVVNNSVTGFYTKEIKII